MDVEAIVTSLDNLAAFVRLAGQPGGDFINDQAQMDVARLNLAIRQLSPATSTSPWRAEDLALHDALIAAMGLCDRLSCRGSDTYPSAGDFSKAAALIVKANRSTGPEVDAEEQQASGGNGEAETPTLDARAAAIKVAHPECGHQRVADEVSCHINTLHKKNMIQYKAAVAALAANRESYRQPREQRSQDD